MDDSLLKSVQSHVSAVLPEIIALRRFIHSEPEVGISTVETARKIRGKLSSTSIALWEPLLGNDVIGELHGKSERKICLRADIDALHIQEISNLPYVSKKPGYVHGCGHDGHTAALVGAALVLDAMKDVLPNSVRFVFQPGEELLCAGKDLVEKGACDGCEAAFALHAWPGLPVGAIASRDGVLMAAGIQYKITITGKGCHGAQPEKGNNPIHPAARIVEQFRQLHTQINQVDGSLVSVCRIESGTQSNIIPDEAVIEGTARFLSHSAGDQIKESMQRIIDDVASEFGVRIEVEYDCAYSLPVLNTQKGYEHVRRAAITGLGEGSWLEYPDPSMGMEDFAFYLPSREGALFFLGMGEGSAPLHSACFNFNDDALAAGIMMHSLIALTPL